MKNLKAKKSAAQARKGPKKLDEAQIKEVNYLYYLLFWDILLLNDLIIKVMELQEQIQTNSKDLRIVQSKLSAAQRDSRINSATLNHVQSLDQGARLYRSVGKAFVFAEKNDIETRLESEIEELTKAQRDYLDKQEYLERRIKSATNNLRDIIS